MKIFSNKEIDQIVRDTIKHDHVSLSDLTERAGRAIADEINAHWLPDVQLVVFAGWGNNGADALSTARHLALMGYNPEVYLFNIGGDRLSDECRHQRDMLLSATNVKFKEIDGKTTFQWPDIDASSLIIDGLFGSGLDRALPRSFVMLAGNINDSGATVVAIDIPSGMMSDWNSHFPRQQMIHASLTLSIGFPRPAFFLRDNAGVVGRWKVIDVGYNQAAVRAAPLTYFLIGDNDVRRFIGQRDEFSSKADFGHVLIAAGSYGMVGAASLATLGATRAGAGKVTVHAPECAFIPLQTTIPSAMFDADKNSRHLSSIPTDSRYTAIAVGPGIGTDSVTIDALERFLKVMQAGGRPVVLDADALNCIATRRNLLEQLPPLSVLTPHPGEFDRLFGVCANDEERLKNALAKARLYQIIIILKGRYTAIVRPDGKVFFNSSGSPALATAGSGDVLTGVIASLIASGLKPEIAAFVGTHIHGVAGELAAETHSDIGTTAADIADNIGRAIVAIARD